jgi:hypothetical protein
MAAAIMELERHRGGGAALIGEFGGVGEENARVQRSGEGCIFFF